VVIDQASPVGRKVDIRQRSVFVLGPGQVFYPLAGLVSDISSDKVFLTLGGYETKEIILSQIGDIPLKNLFWLPGEEGVSLRKGRSLAFQKNSARLMTDGSEDLTGMKIDAEVLSLHGYLLSNRELRITSSHSFV
jgi:predicted RecA/RadA family phage recombinase